MLIRPTRKLALREFVPLAALLMSLSALSIDAVLPALPEIGRDLGALRLNDVQFVVTSVFVGFALGQLVIGPLSDRIGRRPAMLAGLAVFLAGCAVSVLASSFEVMIAGRVLQGIGASSPRVVTIALVRDQFKGRQMARLLSFVMAVFILVPIIAPALGQGLLRFGGWRTIFVAFVVIALATVAWFGLRQPETLRDSLRRPFSVRAIARGFVEVLRIRPALGYTLATGLIFAPFIAYLSSAQQIFRDAYQTGALFPLWFAVVSLGLGLAALANGRLVIRQGMRRICRFATLSIAAVSLLALPPTWAFDGLPPFWLFLVWLIAVFVCTGLLFGNLNALAMEPLGHLAGVGAAFVGSVSNVIALPFGVLIGQLFDGTVVPQIAAFALMGLAAWAAIRWADAGSPATTS